MIPTGIDACLDERLGFSQSPTRCREPARNFRGPADATITETGLKISALDLRVG